MEVANVAQQVSVKLVDDIDGSEASQTVAFVFDGRSYEIDLSEDNTARLRDAISPFVKAARRAGGARRTTDRSRSSRAAANREPIAEIRKWARAPGHNVPDRGRIPTNVLNAYEAENK